MSTRISTSRPTCPSCRSHFPAADLSDGGLCGRYDYEISHADDGLCARTDPTREQQQEIAARLAAVRAAKERRGRRGLRVEELDEVLPPIECARTRKRLKKRLAARLPAEGGDPCPS